jgi:uncharacterized membrane protein
MFLLAHHHPEEHYRCVQVAGWPLCSRCLGLYPVLLATLALELGSQSARAAAARPLDLVLLYGLPIPALVDYGLGCLGARGSNLARLLTGALLGVSLGHGLHIYFRHPASLLFWIQIAALAIPAALLLVVGTRARRRRLARERVEADARGAHGNGNGPS